MDFQRVVLWGALLVVSYLMILQWKEDYATTPVPVAQAPAIESTDRDTHVATSTEFSATPESHAAATTNSADATIASTTNSAGQIRIVTDVLDLTIALEGGNIDRADLLAYPQSLENPAPLSLLRKDNQRRYWVESGLYGANGYDSTRNGPTPVYAASATTFRLVDGQEELVVDLTFQREGGVALIKRYHLKRGSYEIRVSYDITNATSTPFEANFSAKIVRDQSADPSSQPSLGMASFLGMAVSSPEEPYEKFTFDDLAEKPLNTTITGGWLAFIQHYFLAAWVPDADQPQTYQTLKRGDLHLMGFVGPATVVAPGQQATVGARLYLGPKIIDNLEAVAPKLDLTVDYGFLFFIAKPLFIVLEWFYGLVHNWGVSIILLTLLVKALFFHLSATSYRSMANMRRVAPELQRMKELYGDDRQKMSQAMMDLYRKEKINPLGGCLPVLVQMPVFIALYWVLFESVQLRQAPFFGWIQDLSLIDPYFVLPLLMGATMFIQTMLNPAPPDPTQARVMKMMPVIFTVFFLWFPSGLVLYWVVNNMLSIAQQWVITRQIEAGAHKAKS